MAQDVIDVILGEAKGKSYTDMLHVASVIANRAKSLGVSLSDVVRNKQEFNAYGKPLPPGVGKYRSLAEKALTEVQTKGPVTEAQFYATPAAAKNLPKGLQKVTSTDGHDYFVDPQKRSIATAVGYRSPRLTPQMLGKDNLQGPASASAVASVNLGKGNGLGLMNLAPSMVANDGTVKTAMADPRMDPKVADIAASLGRGGFGDIGVRSGFRTPSENREVGGARNSQHLYGTAMDLGVKGLPEQQKAVILDRALMGGAKGVGLYRTGAMHVDARQSPAFWGPNGNDAYEGTTAAAAPDWARPMIEQNMAGGPYLPMQSQNIPVPTPRQPMAMMAEARAFDRGGIIDAPKVSLNPVSTANAGERPQTKVIRAPVQSGWTPADQASRQAPAKTSTGISFSRVQTPQTLYNRSGGAANDFRPMPSGPIAQSQPAMRDRSMPSGLMTAPQTAPVASPASVAAAYQQYGQTRMAAPQSQMNAQSATSPNINVAAMAGTMTTPIPGPLEGQAIQNPGAFPAQPAAPTLKQRAMGTLRNAMSPDNLKKAGLTAVGGALGGPVGAAIGGLLGNAMNNPQQGGILSGILSSLGGNGNQSMQSTYIGNGVNAVSQAMYGNRRGDTATYNSQGGGSVTNLGNGESQRTSNKYGWTETTHRDGSKSIAYKK